MKYGDKYKGQVRGLPQLLIPRHPQNQELSEKHLFTGVIYRDGGSGPSSTVNFVGLLVECDSSAHFHFVEYQRSTAPDSFFFHECTNAAE